MPSLDLPVQFKAAIEKLTSLKNSELLLKISIDLIENFKQAIFKGDSYEIQLALVHKFDNLLN